MKVKVIGQRSRFQKRWSKVKVTRVMVKVTKVVGQGHRVKVKVV